MKTIDLKKLIESSDLDSKEVAKQLFPKNKYPDLALNRVMKGLNVLDADQISKLSLLSGVPISELFSGGEWKGSTAQNVHVFTNGEYRAELDPQTWITKVFHKGSLFHDSIIHSGSTPINEYLHELDQIIINFKNKQK